MESDKRTPTFNRIAEEAVVGAILLKNSAMSTVASKLTSEDFFLNQNRTLYSAMEQLYSEGSPIDVVTLSTKLTKMGALEEIGGLDYLLHISSAVPSAANITYYANLVEQDSLKRKLQKECSRVASDALSVSSEFETLIEGLHETIYKLRAASQEGEILNADQLAELAVSLLEREKMGLETKLPELDQLIETGLQPSDFVVLAARPSMGKTALGLRLAINFAVQDVPVMFFSYEMGKGKIAKRLAAMVAKTPFKQLKKDVGKAVRNCSELAKLPIHSAHLPSRLSDLKSRAAQEIKGNGIKVIIVDYLQKLETVEADGDYRRVTKISNVLKSIATDHNTVVIALAQLNRKVEERADKRPIMSDLRDSGAIEQDADLIIGLYRDKYYNKASEDNTVEAIILKQRDGGLGTARLVFNEQTADFLQISPEPRYVARDTYKREEVEAFDYF